MYSKGCVPSIHVGMVSLSIGGVGSTQGLKTQGVLLGIVV